MVISSPCVSVNVMKLVSSDVNALQQMVAMSLNPANIHKGKGFAMGRPFRCDIPSQCLDMLAVLHSAGNLLLR